MNKILTMFLALVFTMFLSAFTFANPIQIPAKYDLGKQLEEVQWFWNVGYIDWEAVDNQSVVVETSPGHYYLLVLTVPSYDLPLVQNKIGITHSGSRVEEGLDSVIVWSPAHYYNNYPIERIYKIKGSEQMRAIISQLQGQKTDTHTY
jgi:hypothetical protein